MMPRTLFVDHVGVLGGAELALMDVAGAYRDTSTFLLFADGPLRQRLHQAGATVRVFDGGSALHRVRRDTRWPGLGAAMRVLSLAWRVSRLARKHDLIHANSQKAFVVACLAGILARRPVVWLLHDLLSDQHFSRANIRLGVGLANHCAHRVIANSHASARALIKEGGREDKVRVVYNGLDAGPFDAVSADEVEQARSELGLIGVPVIGVFGRLAPWKGQHVAIEAVAALPGVHLILVGDALFGEEEYAARLESQAAAAGVLDRVHFLGFRPDIPRLMRLCSIVLHTSIAPEPFGRVIVEGMLARRPVIATRGGGVEEIVEHEVSGVLVGAGSASELVAAVSGLLRDKERAARLAGAGRAIAETRFTIAAMLEGLTANLVEVAAQ